ncbi:MAG: hypothetical protein M1831_001521 [Alyxoria varia]|nr:MAG: hypothetical protein M1831_001521 [Alyxoria varia]
MPTWLITGANRGIGKGLVSTVISRPNHTVIAGVREPIDETSQSLTSLPTATGSSVIIVKIDAKIPSDAKAAIKKVKVEHNITALDVVVANSGIFHSPGPLHETTPETINDHLQVNSIGSVMLFGATRDLLKASEKNPKFIYISAVLASITLSYEMGFENGFTAYCMSKAAANWAMAQANRENPDITVLTVHPGWVDTRMGWVGADLGNTKPPDKLEDSVAGIMRETDDATKDKVSEFRSFDGSTLPW